MPLFQLPLFLLTTISTVVAAVAAAAASITAISVSFLFTTLPRYSADKKDVCKKYAHQLTTLLPAALGVHEHQRKDELQVQET